MEQLQSFRTELVEWLKEIVPFNRIDQYIRKTREGLNTSPDAGRHDNHVNYILVTDKHRYSISAHPDYLGCIASTTFYLPGEDWTRGNDLPDGPFCYATWQSIKDAIIRYELVKLTSSKTALGNIITDFLEGNITEVPFSGGALPDASNVPALDPAHAEWQQANAELWRAKERFERAERALSGQNVRDEAAAPLDMPKVKAYHASEKVG